jgi:hypothetical protein
MNTMLDNDKLQVEYALEIVRSAKSNFPEKQMALLDESPRIFSYVDSMGDAVAGHWETSPSGNPLALPFSYCAFSFENMVGLPIISLKNFPNLKQLLVTCLLIKEISPTEFSIFIFGQACKTGCDFKYNENHAIKSHFLMGVFMPIDGEKEWEDSSPRQIRALLENVALARLNGQLAEEPFHRRAKLRKNGKFTNQKLSRVIYIRKQKSAGNPPSENVARQIEWKNTWLVRGHWRHIEGLGKNRAGDYIVKNFTWVKDHVKGPEAAPLINKTRVVGA